MQRYIYVRVVQATVTLLILSLAVFLSVHLTGDPAAYLLGPEAGRLEYEQIKKNMGLDKPLAVQYGLFLGRVLRGDFGNSHITGRSARDVLIERFPATLQLAGVAFLLTVAVGVPLGTLSAVKRDSIFDQVGKFFAVVGIAAPSFWIAIMLILLFGAILGWLPTFGRGGIEHFILPAFVLSWHSMAGVLRLARSSMLDVMDSEYVKFARIKGLSEKLVIAKHALKNAGHSGAHLLRPHPGGTAQRFGGHRGGLRLARHRPADAGGDQPSRFPGCPGDGAGGGIFLHCHRPVGGHPLRLRQPPD